MSHGAFEIRAGHQWSSSAGPGHAAAMSAASLNCKQCNGCWTRGKQSQCSGDTSHCIVQAGSNVEGKQASPGTHRTDSTNGACAGTPARQPDAGVQAAAPMGAAQFVFRCWRLPVHLQQLSAAAAAAAIAGGAPAHLSRQASQSSEQQEMPRAQADVAVRLTCHVTHSCVAYLPCSCHMLLCICVAKAPCGCLPESHPVLLLDLDSFTGCIGQPSMW